MENHLRKARLKTQAESFLPYQRNNLIYKFITVCLMTIQELFSSKPIVEIEEQILDHFPDTARHPFKKSSKRVIEELLKVRKRLLDEHFVFDETTKALLRDFNEAIKSEPLRMRAKAIKMHEAILQLYPDKADDSYGGFAPLLYLMSYYSFNYKVMGAALPSSSSRRLPPLASVIRSKATV